MTDEQANNKLPEKTLQQIAEKFIHDQIGISIDAPDDTPMDKKECVYCLVKLTEFYEEVVSQKVSLIELTNNNLLAALEEVKMLKEELQTLKSEYNELWDQAQSWREESGNLPRP